MFIDTIRHDLFATPKLEITRRKAFMLSIVTISKYIYIPCLDPFLHLHLTIHSDKG